MGNACETPFFFDMPTNTTVGTNKITGLGKLRITVIVSIRADLRNETPFFVLKKYNTVEAAYYNHG
jgi:hypothetical protein